MKMSKEIEKVVKIHEKEIREKLRNGLFATGNKITITIPKIDIPEIVFQKLEETMPGKTPEVTVEVPKQKYRSIDDPSEIG